MLLNVDSPSLSNSPQLYYAGTHLSMYLFHTADMRFKSSKHGAGALVNRIPCRFKKPTVATELPESLLNNQCKRRCPLCIHQNANGVQHSARCTCVALVHPKENSSAMTKRCHKRSPARIFTADTVIVVALLRHSVRISVVRVTLQPENASRLQAHTDFSSSVPPSTEIQVSLRRSGCCRCEQSLA